MIKLQRRNFLTAITLAPFIPLLPVRPEQLITRKFYLITGNGYKEVAFETLKKHDFVQVREGKKIISAELEVKEDWSSKTPESIVFQNYDV